MIDCSQRSWPILATSELHSRKARRLDSRKCHKKITRRYMIKKFNLYREIQVKVEEIERATFAQFPNAFLILERELRNLIIGKSASSVQNYKRQIKNSYLKYFLRSTLGARLLNLGSKKNGQTILLKLTAHPELQKEISSRARIYNFSLASSQERNGRRFLKYLESVALCCSSWDSVVASILLNGLESGLNNAALVMLERQVRVNKSKLKVELNRRNICCVVMDGDSTPFQRILADACHDLGIPFIVISHCYVQEPHLNAIAPLRASHFVAWTEDQRDCLADILDPLSIGRVKFFGFPRPKIDIDGHRSNVLIAWPSILASDSILKNVNDLRQVFDIVRSSGFQAIVRMHPRDLKSAIVQDALRGAGIQTSKNNIYDDFRSSFCVVGFATSVLVEAAFQGLSVADISEAEFSVAEGSVHVRRENLNCFLVDRYKREVRSDKLPFQVDQFFEFIEEIRYR
jgi:hypothetical protein